MKSKQSDENGFALVELLAVISIIALLAALMFPVVGKALGQAQKTECLENLYNIGLATDIYLPDNDDVYPEVVNYITRYTHISYGRPHGLDPKDYESPITALSAYAKDVRIFRCPNDTGEHDYMTGDKFVPHLWQWNDGSSYMFSELFRGQTSTSLSDIQTSYNVWAVDGGFDWHGEPVPESTGLFWANNLHFDGHVVYEQGSLPYIDFDQIKTSGF